MQISMTIESGMELGISIRGGAEHGLGIYISMVDPASVADLHGIQVLMHACMHIHNDSLYMIGWEPNP